MFRAITVIVAAIQLDHPKVSDDEALVIARALQEQAESHEFDPLTGVSIIHHESRFTPGAISKDREDYGLAQIRARFIGKCRHTRSPKKNPTSGCLAEKRRLLEPEENIATMAELITHHRQFCKKKVGNAGFARWLASYQGRNNFKKKLYCVPGKGTHKVIEYRRALIRRLYRQGILNRPR